MAVAKPIIDRMMAELIVTLPYLSSVSKDGRTGVINVPYVYGCFDVNEENKPIIHPQMTRVSVQMDLPNGDTIPSPVYSMRMAEYMYKWMNKVGLIYPAITDMV